MEKPKRSQDFDSSKKILYFNNFFHINDWNFGFGLTPFSSCPVSNCYVTKYVDWKGSADINLFSFSNMLL